MKNIVFSLLFSVLVFQISQAQKRYDKWWEEVEELEIKGKSKSALEKSNFIYKKAKKQNKDKQLIKAFLYKTKYELILKEEVYQEVIENFEEEISKQKTPVKQIFSSIYAESLAKYYQQNRYRITETKSSENTEEFQNWNREDFQEKIHFYYKKSLENKSALLQLKDENWKDLLEYGRNYKIYQNTIYDLLARRYLDFLKNESFTIQPKNLQEFHQNYITDSVYFSSSEEFVKLEIPKSKEEKTLKLYQDLESFEKGKSSLTNLAYQLERLEFVYEKSWIKNKRKLYLESLLNLKNKNTNKEEQDFISFYLAKFYQQNAEKKSRGNYYEKSLAEIENIIKNNTNVEITALSKQLLKAIKKPKITMKTTQVFHADQINKALINYQNIDTLYVSIYENIPDKKLLNVQNSDSLIKDYISKNKADQQQIYQLSNPQKHFEFNTEILLPKLKIGKHLFVFSADKNIKNTNSSLGFHVVDASNIAYVQKRTGDFMRFFITDNQTGKPLNQAEIKLFLADKNQTEKYNLQTDEQGLAKFNPKETKFSNWKGKIIYEKDTLPLKNFSFYKNKPSKEKELTEQKLTTKILTDRGIYRPGQEVFFKGFLIFEEDKKAKPAADFSGKIKLYNSKNQAIDSLEFKTNEFGSFSNEFKLSENELNGRFSLEIETDFEEKTSENESRSFNAQRVYFRVEEYKRPTFKVDFSDLEKHYVLGDSVEVKGKAKAFFGGEISDAKVNYSVFQQANYHGFGNSSPYISIPGFEIKSGVLETDEKGNFKITFPTEDIIEGELNFNYRVFAEITDKNGETHEAETGIHIGNPGVSAEIISTDKINIEKEKSILLKIQDLNRVAVDKNGKFKIYQLEKPERIFRDGAWDIPEIQQISKEEFVKYFPYEVYDSTELKENWKKKLIAEISTSKAKEEIKFEDLPELISGEYYIEWQEEKTSKPIKTEKYILIENPKKKEDKSSKFFDLSYEVKEKSLDLKTTAAEDISLYISLSSTEEIIYEKVISMPKGKNEFSIDLPENLKQAKLEYGYFYQSNFSLKNENLQLKKPEENLIFEVKTFRDKMTPGEKETWELKVLNPDKTPADAEVLASMYDLSLDEFINFKWEENFTQNYYPGFYVSYFHEPYAGINYGLKNITSYFNNPLLQLSKTQLKNFGYSFVNTANVNRQYVSVLSYQKSENSKNALQGLVSDEDNLPFPGVRVEVVGKGKYTKTDFDGRFFIDAKKGDQLRFSGIGFQEKTVIVESEKEVLQVYLEGEVLEEVMVESAAPQANVQGKVSGLTSSYSAEDSLEISGRNTLLDAAEMLFVLDGKQVSQQEVLQLEEKDIVEVKILPAETAVSLYGSAAKNGVVSIITKQAAAELEEIQSRENLQETAFFFPDLKTDKNGNVKFTFENPEALTKWKFQAFAHNKNLQKSYLDLEAITQKDLNIIPNFPRFFRAGDQLIISAKITNLSEEELSGISQLKFIDEITGKEINLIKFAELKEFKAAEKSNTYVEWKLEIPENLTAVRYEISAKSGSFTDAETAVIPVLSNREFITETLPFWLNPKEKKEFVFENLKNNSSKTLKHQSLVLNYTSNPAWTSLQVLPFIAKTFFKGSEQIFAKYYIHGVAEKVLQENPEISEMLKTWKENKTEEKENILAEFEEEIPWLIATYSLEKQQKELAEILAENKKRTQENLENLQKIQLKSGGFPWFEGGNENEAISIYILSGLGKIGKPEEENLKNKYEEISLKLLEYLDQYFLERNKNKSNYNSGSLHYLYARSFFENQQDSLQEIQNKTLKKLEENWIELSLRNKIVLGIVAHRMGNKNLAKTIKTSLKENAVINSSAGMYWKENKSSWYWYETPIETQALAIEFFTEMEEKKENINALKTWLIKQKRLQSWQTTRATTDAIYAILLQGTDLISAENKAKISLGNKNFEVNTENNPTGFFETKFEAEEINKNLADIEIENQSESPQYGGMFWQYFEESDQVKSSDLPELKLEKHLFVEKISAEGKKRIPIAETAVEIGDKIIVKLIIKAKEDFEFMHLSDSRPAGLKPIEVLSGNKFQKGLRFYQTYKDTGVHFFFDRISKGNYEIEYELRANNSGDFSVGIAELRSLYAPEFSAKTKGKRLEIK